VKRISLTRFLAVAVALVILVILPFLVGRAMLTLATEIMIYALFAVAYNLVLGYTGMIGFGHAAFFGIGAYCCATLLMIAKMPMWLGLMAAPCAAAMLALAIGVICVRLTGLFFAFITMGFAQLVWAVFYKSRWSGGADGMFGVPLMSTFYSVSNFYWLVLGIVGLCLVVLWLIVNSSFGLILQAIRDNAGRIEFVGLKYRRYKLASFTISAFFSGIAGALLCLLNRSTSPELLYWSTSGEPLIMALLGGLRVFVGPMLGALLFLGLDKAISNYTLYWQLVLGVIILLVVLVFPGGFTEFAIQRYKRVLDKLRVVFKS
jgi:branched-chain amino acid transport system permease protein